MPSPGLVIRVTKICMVTIALVSASLMPHCPAQSQSQSQNISWQPAHTKALLIGALKWQSQGFASFAAKDRRDAQLYNLLLDKGVPKENITYLSDQNATLSKIEQALENGLDSCQQGDTFIFYYTGHGWLNEENEGFFANYDAGTDENTCLKMNDIVESFAKNFKGSQALFFADCCCSGALANSLKNSAIKFKYSAITSVSASKSSTGDWTFSQCLVDSLTGHSYADANKDGQISYAELAAYARAEMKALEEQNSVSAFGNSFNPNSIFTNVSFKNEFIPERVKVKYEGDWWKAKLVERKGKEARIHWINIGWDAPDSDTWVPLTDVKTFEAVAPVAVPPSFTVNEKVSVATDGDNYPAVILKLTEDKAFVHYDHYETSDDAWVKLSQITRL